MKIYKQETKFSCGIACLRSIFNNYGNNFSEKDIWENTNSFLLDNGGLKNIIMCLGVTALKFGFDVTYIGYNPILINNNISEDLKESLKEKSKTNFELGKFYVDETLKFLELNGKIKINKLNINELKKIIDSNKFVLVEIKPSFINKKASLSMHHKIILIGYTKKGFKFLDPSDAKEHIVDFDTFLLAFYAAVPELLVIKMKK
jgi:ABC-type bacteriocin/lantibiotic exporter with double-glycine peptidase domain